MSKFKTIDVKDRWRKYVPGKMWGHKPENKTWVYIADYSHRACLVWMDDRVEIEVIATYSGNYEVKFPDDGAIGLMKHRHLKKMMVHYGMEPESEKELHHKFMFEAEHLGRSFFEITNEEAENLLGPGMPKRIIEAAHLFVTNNVPDDKERQAFIKLSSDPSEKQ